ncbi:MAG: Rpn family recombination-promoting nuclease/putative transposase [Clostridia bacterium]|nr:Rpn family recombination-promoting nuclease/putative transposase [Clostridia bacterium]
MEDENINKAKKVLETISQDERERRLTELREKYRMDQHAIMLAGYDKGLKEGIEQGLEKGIEQNKKDILEKLLKTDLSIEQIMEITGFTAEEIEKLKK